MSEQSRRPAAGAGSQAGMARPGVKGRRTGARGRGRRRGRHRSGLGVPDILYHATSEQRFDRAVAQGFLDRGDGRQVYLSTHEAQAWQVGHRQRHLPKVFVVDAARSQRAGVRYSRNRQGLWQAKSIPGAFLLNTLDGYGEQVSAGGFPIYWGPNGPELLMIQVRRRSGLTWEVAKGKLELGESPWQAAIREVQEEIGCSMELSVSANMGAIRYGFRTPERQPRLKTVHIYLLNTPKRELNFDPAGAEGIEDVGWFTPSQAARAVSHRSLRPMVYRIRSRLESGTVQP